MTTIFLKKQLIQSNTDLLQYLQQTALEAGWAKEAGNFDALPFLLKSGHSVNNRFAWIEFSLNGDFIQIKGLIDGVTASTPFIFPFAPSNGHLWVTADDRAIAFVVIEASLMFHYVLGWQEQIYSSKHWGLHLIKNVNLGNLSQLAGTPTSDQWIVNNPYNNLTGNYFGSTAIYYGTGPLYEAFTGRILVTPFYRGSSDGNWGFVPFTNSSMFGSVLGEEYTDNEGNIWLGTGQAGLLVGGVGG